MEDVFEKVEKVLKDYPLEFKKNYYDNKKTVKIEWEEQVVNNVFGSYDNEKNEIKHSKFEALPHELFHMAFRCSENIGKEIIKDSGLYYGNGISFIKYKNNEPQYFQLGINEGFAEYLSRKCCSHKGHSFKYYFVNLLISIYGEDILKYPLTNDPYGLILDSRFFNIVEYSINIENLHNAIEMFGLLNIVKDFFKKIKDLKDKEEIFSIFQQTKNNCINSIIELFKCIIKEYINYPKNLSEEQFIVMLEDFLKNPDYDGIFIFDDEYPLKDELISIINNFKKESKRIALT